MSDRKEKTRAQLLGELESIKDLLHQEEDERYPEPPLLTTPLEDSDDAPLLTEIHDTPDGEDASFPQDLTTEEAVLEPEQEPGPPEAAETPTTEQQPSLFEASELEAIDATVADAPQAVTQPNTVEAKPTPSLAKGENPFLPKHIRDRLTANRKNQSALMESFAPPATSPPPPADNTAEQKDQALIDELVQRFLPDIEAALRERLQAMIREERDSPKVRDSDD